MSFLVPKTPLADHQKERLTEVSLTGDSSATFALSSLLQKNDIVVCTPQILINNLESHGVQLESVSLIVFDKCHHCKGKAYATIIIKYRITEMIRRRKHSRMIYYFLICEKMFAIYCIK